MPKFRKKPVVIEAMQFKANDVSGYAILNWANTLISQADPREPFIGWVNDKIRIPTLEGIMEASDGDWIIRGVSGEFYPCKPDIFEATYDAVSDDTDAEPRVFLTITLPRHRVSLPDLIETITAQIVRGVRAPPPESRSTARQSDKPNEEIGEGVRMIGGDQSEKPVPFEG